MAERAGIGWKWLEVAGNDWNSWIDWELLNMAEIAKILEMAENDWKWLKIIVNCRKWLDKAGNGYNWLNMDILNCKWL